MRYHRMITIDAINRTKTKVQIIELSRCDHAIIRIYFHQQTKCSRHRISMWIKQRILLVRQRMRPVGAFWCSINRMFKSHPCELGLKQTCCRVVYHILETCHTSKNLWIIDNFAGFKFCSLRVSLAKSQWARLVYIIGQTSQKLTKLHYNCLVKFWEEKKR